MDDKELIEIIFGSIRANVIMTNRQLLISDPEYEHSRAIGTILAVGFSDMLGVEKEQVINRLCIERAVYKTKLNLFKKIVEDRVDYSKPMNIIAKRRINMVHRSIFRQLEDKGGIKIKKK